MDIEQKNLMATANLFSLLSDPTRLRLFLLLLSNENICVTDLSKKAEISLSATSHQLRKMEFLGIVEKCRYGQEICYCVNSESDLAKKMIQLLQSI